MKINMRQEVQNFSSFLQERLAERGVSLKRLAETTGVPLSFLENILTAADKKLPPPPYLRGYLFRLGRALDFDPEPWWKELKEKEDFPAAGPGDKLPENRFAVKVYHRRLWFAAAIAVLVYLSFQAYLRWWAKPQIEVSYPGAGVTELNTETLNLWGKTKNADKIYINGEEVTVRSDGSWEKNIQLLPGLNTVEITARRFLGGETKILRQVMYRPSEKPSPPALPPEKNSN